MSYHDPIRQSKYLRQTLSQDKKPVGFFISAGCPLAVSMPEGKWPLIPDVAGLTKYIKEEIDKETSVVEGATRCSAVAYTQLIEEVEKAGKTNPNIEDILSFLRGMKQIS